MSRRICSPLICTRSGWGERGEKLSLREDEMSAGPFTEEELSAFDAACDRAGAALREAWSKPRRSRDPNAKPTQAELRRNNHAMSKNARMWKDWEPKP